MSALRGVTHVVIAEVVAELARAKGCEEAAERLEAPTSFLALQVWLCAAVRGGRDDPLCRSLDRGHFVFPESLNN